MLVRALPPRPKVGSRSPAESKVRSSNASILGRKPARLRRPGRPAVAGRFADRGLRWKLLGKSMGYLLVHQGGSTYPVAVRKTGDGWRAGPYGGTGSPLLPPAVSHLPKRTQPG